MVTSAQPEKPGQSKGVLAPVLRSLAVLLVASLLCEGLYRLGVGEQSISIVMVLAVFIIAATTEGYWYGLAATLVAVLVYDYLVTEPRFGFSITLGFPITLSIMLLVALVTSSITTRIKKQTRIARSKEQRAELLYEINRKLLSSRDESTIARYALEYISGDLHRSVALFTTFDSAGSHRVYFRQAQGDVGQDFFEADAEQAAILQAAGQGQRAGTGAPPVQVASGYYRPVALHGTVHGVVGISCQAGPIPESRLPFLSLIAEQTAQALRMQALTKKQQETMLLAEMEKHAAAFCGASRTICAPRLPASLVPAPPFWKTMPNCRCKHKYTWLKVSKPIPSGC